MSTPFFYEELKPEFRQFYLDCKALYLSNHPNADEESCAKYAEMRVKKKARTLYDYEHIKHLIDNHAPLSEILSAHKCCHERMTDGNVLALVNDIILGAKSVIDIGCGLNPCFAKNIYSNISEYYCYDKDKHVIDIAKRINQEYLHGTLTFLDSLDDSIINNGCFNLLLVLRIIPSLYKNSQVRVMNKIADINTDYVVLTGSKLSLSRNISIQQQDNVAIEWFIKRYSFIKKRKIETNTEFGWLLKKVIVDK